MREGAYMRGGLIRGVTQMVRKRWAYLRGDYTRGGGLIRGEIRYMFIWLCLPLQERPSLSKRYP